MVCGRPTAVIGREGSKEAKKKQKTNDGDPQKRETTHGFQRATKCSFAVHGVGGRQKGRETEETTSNQNASSDQAKRKEARNDTQGEMSSWREGPILNKKRTEMRKTGPTGPAREGCRGKKGEGNNSRVTRGLDGQKVFSGGAS